MKLIHIVRAVEKLLRYRRLLSYVTWTKIINKLPILKMAVWFLTLAWRLIEAFCCQFFIWLVIIILLFVIVIIIVIDKYFYCTQVWFYSYFNHFA